MSINGITNPLLSNLGVIVRPDATRTISDRSGTTAPAVIARPVVKPQSPIAGHSAKQHTVPADAPAGTDPALWSVLTADERNFFAKTAALGPLTYGRIKAAAPAAPPTARGARLDVRA